MLKELVRVASPVPLHWARTADSPSDSQQVTKFGYSELESLLTFAPRLLDYQMQADRPSLLSKIFGIYTIKIQDLKTGEKRKLDLIVMDNLFHSQSQDFPANGVRFCAVEVTDYGSSPFL